MSVIAVYSGIYCSAEEIIESIAKRIGYTIIDKALLEEASRKFGTTAEKLARTLAGERGFFNRITHEWEKNLIYLRASVGEMLKTDDQIYLGPAMQLIPRQISHVLRVGVIADRSYRIQKAKVEDQLDSSDAEEHIAKKDQELAQWTEQLFSCNPWDPKLYDIKIPLPSTTVQQAVDLIFENIEKEALKPTDASIQAVLDFQLATRVNVILLEAGHYNCSVSAEKEHLTVIINQRPPPPGKLARTVRSVRFENIEEDVLSITSKLDGVSSVDVRPGAGYRPRSDLHPARTLLVDDEREFVLTLSERLEVRNIPSDVVHDGQQALTYVKTSLPDVMVLDLRMPGMDGLDVLRWIKKEHPQVEVIIVTGHGSEKDEKLARDLGAFDFLSKPVDIKILAQRIRAASKKNQASLEATVGDRVEDK